MKIILIGTGMYVSGRGTNNYGTIFPAICEFQRKTSLISELLIVKFKEIILSQPTEFVVI